MTELSNQTKRQWAKYSPPSSPIGTHESRVLAVLAAGLLCVAGVVVFEQWSENPGLG